MRLASAAGSTAKYAFPTMRSYGPAGPNARPSSTSERSSTSIRNSAAFAAAHSKQRIAAVRTMRSSLPDGGLLFAHDGNAGREGPARDHAVHKGVIDG